MSYLQKRVVIVKPIPETFNPDVLRIDKKHVAKFMLPHCTTTIMLRLDEQTRGLKRILTEEEQTWFEKELGMKPGDLSFYRTGTNPGDTASYNYWYGFQVRLKSEEELRLDLSNIIDNLRYRVLLVDRQIAPSWEERLDKPSYRWALVDENYVVKANTESGELKRVAYLEYDKIKDSKEKLISVLKIMGRSYTLDVEISVLQNDVFSIIETPKTSSGNNIVTFLSAVKDKDSKTKVFITDAIRVGDVKLSKNKYYTKAGDNVANSLAEMIDYCDNVENQEWRKLIEENIKKS